MLVNNILDLVKLPHRKLEMVIKNFDLRTCTESSLTTAEAMRQVAKLHLGYLMSHSLTI